MLLSRNNYLVLIVLFLFSITAWSANPDSSEFLPDSWQDNLRFAIDLSGRAIYNNESEEFAHAEFLGFDLHKVFSGDQGDIGTLVLQGYLTRINNLQSRPFFFDDKNDWEFVYRIFNFNYALLPRDHLNVRVGHFEIPFGLEHTINTNGTLRDYTHGRNLGVKADWGVALNGNLPEFEYEVSISRGSGNNWETRGDPSVIAGRIGTHRNNNKVFGVSLMTGEVYSPASPTFVVDRERYGVDFQSYFGVWGLLAEFSLGEDDGQDIRNGLVELNFSSQDNAILVYGQLVRFATKTIDGQWNRALAAKLGTKWDINRYWDLSAQLTVDVDTFAGAPESEVLAIQARYRF